MNELDSYLGINFSVPEIFYSFCKQSCYQKASDSVITMQFVSIKQSAHI